MRDKTIEVGEGFWNIRGSFRIGGLIDVGTQASLVRRANGKFVFLDSYTLTRAVRQEIDALTDDGRNIEAIVNLHPFHTVHVRALHETYPHARLYGTARHLSRFPELPWQDVRSEDPELHSMFAGEFEFSIPAGVDFISADENVHFSSVLVLHRPSQTIHVDDTFMYIRLPAPMRFLGLADATSFHLTLAKALERRAGAAAEFRGWAETLIERWKDAQNLCAAHTATLLGRENRGASIHARLTRALAKVSGTLETHERRYG